MGLCRPLTERQELIRLYVEAIPGWTDLSIFEATEMVPQVPKAVLEQKSTARGTGDLPV